MSLIGLAGLTLAHNSESDLNHFFTKTNDTSSELLSQCILWGKAEKRSDISGKEYY